MSRTDPLEILKMANLIVAYDYTYKEVSTITGIPHSTVGKHMLYTLRDLAPDLHEQVQQIVSKHIHKYKRGGIKHGQR